jgi:hypothetical protein
MAHTRGPFTVEELSESAETERELGITRIICAPSDIAEDRGDSMAVAFVIQSDDAPLFASVLDLLEAAEVLLAGADPSEDEPEVTLVDSVNIAVLRAAVAKARTVA